MQQHDQRAADDLRTDAKTVDREDLPDRPELPEEQPRAEAETPERAEPPDGPESIEQPRAEHDEPAEVAADEAPPPSEEGEQPARMFRPEDADRIRAQLQRIQAEFVDDPRDAVQSANRLLSEALRSLTTAVNELEGQWRQGSGEQTEDLRQALRRYRSVLNQLLDA